MTNLLTHSATRPLLLAAALLAPAAAGGQQPVLPSVPQGLSLTEAVRLASVNSPALRQVVNNRGPAAWGVRNAYAAFLPSLSVGGGVSYSGEGAQNFLSEQFRQQSGSLGSSYDLGLSWQFSGSSLMLPGLRKAQLRATDAAADGARINLASTVTQQYLAVLQATAQVELAEVQLRRNEEFLRLARARFEVGQATILDVRQAEVARGQAEVGLLQARNEVTVRKLRLFQQIGVPAPDDPGLVVLTDSFPIVEPAWSLRDLLRGADQQNPDLVSLRAQETSARAAERSAKSAWFPSLSFSAGWSGFTQQYTNDDFLVARAQQDAQANHDACLVQNQIHTAVGLALLNCALFQFTTTREQQIRDANRVFPFDFTRQPFSARLSISLPIFDQFSRPLRVAEAAAQTDDARESVRARELQVRTDVSQAHYGLLTAFQTVGLQDGNRTAAQDQLRLATERYRVGSGTFFELLDAQLAAQRAESDYINAVYSYHQAIAALESAVGRPLR